VAPFSSNCHFAPKYNFFPVAFDGIIIMFYLLYPDSVEKPLNGLERLAALSYRSRVAFDYQEVRQVPSTASTQTLMQPRF